MATAEMTEKKIRLIELEELLGFTEKVSDRIRTLEDELSRYKLQMMMLGTALFTSVVLFVQLFAFRKDSGGYSPDLFALLLCSLFVGIVMACVVLRNRFRLRNRALKELWVEIRLIGRLANMLSSLIEILNEKEVGIVPLEMLRMRLSRISMSDKRIT